MELQDGRCWRYEETYRRRDSHYLDDYKRMIVGWKKLTVLWAGALKSR